MQDNIPGMQTFWHIKVSTLPDSIQQAVYTLFRENSVPTYQHASLRWELSPEMFEVSVSDKEHDEAANTVNKYFTQESTITLAPDMIVFFDL